MKLLVLISGLLINVAVASTSKQPVIECKRVVVIKQDGNKKVISALPNVIQCKKK